MAPAENPADLEQIDPDLVVEGSPESVETTAAGTPVADEVVAPADKPDEIADLKKQLEEANKGRVEAESRANSLAAEKSTAESRVQAEVSGRFAAVEQSIDVRATAAKSAIASIKAEMVRAAAEQRYEDQAELQEKMADAKIEERQAAADKQNLAAHKERLKTEIEAQSTRSRDPSEQFLANVPGEPSRQWLRNHPEILRKAVASPSEAKRLYAYANIAEANGHAPDSDGYFDAIEQQFGLKESTATVTTTARPAPKDPGRTASAAPSTRSAPPGATQRVVQLDDVVRKLTPNDRAAAKISFPDKPSAEAEKLYAQGIIISKSREKDFRPDIRL